MVFPKLIHLVYLVFDSPTMPEAWRKNLEEWKKKNPDYKVILWNDKMADNLLDTKYPDLKDMYYSYKYNIQRADVIRYLIMHSFGGVYTDLDIVPNYPIDPFVNLYEQDDNIEVVLPVSPNLSNVTSNFFIISKKDTPFWDSVIENLQKNSKKKIGGKHETIMWQSGPKLLNEVYKQYNKKNGTKVVIIPKELVSACDTCGNRIGNFSYLTDQHASSWHGKDSEFYNKVYCATRPLSRIPWYIWFIIAWLGMIVIIVVIIFLVKCKKTCKNEFNKKFS